ncbi:MAG: anthranilate synthase component I [Synergistaceae bacterium]|nr:anthranilate synthase component I [Synergistaceae bacterium]
MYPTLEDVRALARSGDYRRVPVCRELYADRYTPVEVMRTLRAAGRHCFLLESAENNQRWGRYSFLGCAPTLELTCSEGMLRIREDVDGEEVRERVEEVDHPGAAIRAVLERHRSHKVKGLPPFCGGLVGYFPYDYLKYAEPTLRGASEERDFRDVDLMLFDRVIAFDHYRQKLVLIAGVPTDDIEEGYHRAEAIFDETGALLESGAKAAFKPLRLKEELTPRFSKDEFRAMVERAKDHIREGDIFQVVLSNPLTADAEGSLFDTYRVLRTLNPSPYMFYFSSDDIEIAGASPETLARLEDGALYTFPLAGTRRRGADEAEDAALERELLADEKELAEHNMLVDLGRNDLGRVCRLNSVRVEEYMAIQRFSHVMHIGSTVSGLLRADRDAVDAVDSILPAGTLSGAPKIRACEIIRELDGGRRGIYGGAVGYLDFSGNMDTCIAIRLAYKKDGRLCVQSGAGIVADSVPEREYRECADKARAVVRALRDAEGGL